MQLPQVIEVKGIRVLTTHQIAESYEVKEIQISQNFKNNRQRFVEGKHYISLSGDDLRTFKNQLEKIEVVKSRTSHLYLWTEKGALLHAKSLNTDKAWQVYEYLVDFYFRAKENEPEIPEKKVPEKKVSKKIDISSEAKILKAIHKVRKDLICMDVLLEKCENEKWESRYTDTKFEVADLAWIIAADCNTFLDLRPKTIQEYQ